MSGDRDHVEYWEGCEAHGVKHCDELECLPERVRQLEQDNANLRGQLAAAKSKAVRELDDKALEAYITDDFGRYRGSGIRRWLDDQADRLEPSPPTKSKKSKKEQKG